ncbi:MAG TPA: glutamine-hydrolyzing carbamoyl-phosphate synthase small subunit [Gemmatimonadota bacterium]
MPFQHSSSALLLLEDGRAFPGRSFGAEGEAFGEAVFNTALSGYQEVLTDPSYAGQIVTMTVPLVGNTGIVPGDGESERIQVAGFVVREATRRHSSWRARRGLPETLREQAVVAIEGVDTRALTLHLRERGAMRAGLSTVDLDPASLLRRVLAIPRMEGQDLTALVSCAAPHLWEGREPGFPAPAPGDAPSRALAAPRFRVAALDCGAKANIFRLLHARGCELLILPSSAGAEELLERQPDGIFLSNGPGDPDAVRGAIDTLRELHRLAPEIPTFGICLGFQLLALAHGGDTYKLRFGHRGVNHPVRNRLREAVEITSQNHGFAVRGDEGALADMPAFEVTHVNLNDGTLEGFRHRELPIFAVQYHPEAAPGPHDSRYLFDEFVAAMAAAGSGARSAAPHPRTRMPQARPRDRAPRAG